MYNRYIPQPDGSYRRNSVPDQRRRPQKPTAPPPKPEPPPCPPEPCQSCQPTEPHCVSKQSWGAGDFLRRLIPKNLDTGDLLIIVLLLLMSADCEEDKNSALLTLALYLFL